MHFGEAVGHENHDRAVEELLPPFISGAVCDVQSMMPPQCGIFLWFPCGRYREIKVKKVSSQTQVTLRDAVRRDSCRLLPMIRALAKHHGDVANINRQVLARDAFDTPQWIYILVAEIEGEVVGYAALCPLIQLQAGLRGVDMHHLFVEEECRGFGIGRKLIEASIRKAGDLSCDYMMVGTHPDNTDAQSVYLACGFEQRYGSHPRFRISLRN